MWVWEWMFQGSVFIVMVLFLRLILLDRLPKRAFSVLWTACTIQLLLPVGQLLDIPGTFDLGFLQAGGEAMRRCVETVVDTPLGLLPRRLARHLALGRNCSIRPLLCFWLLGAGSFALFFLVGHLRGRQLYAESLPVDDPFVRLWAAENQGERRGVSVRVSDRVAAPLTFGVLRPVVLLPRSMDWEDRETLSYVLAHEFHHVYRCDALRKLGFAAALCVHWFNPLSWLMYVTASRDLELDCDETAAGAFPWGSREGYARTLIAMEERRSFGSPLSSCFCRSALEARVKALMSRKRCGRLHLAVAGMVVCALAMVGTAGRQTVRMVDLVTYFSYDPVATPIPTSDVVEWDEAVQVEEGPHGAEMAFSEYETDAATKDGVLAGFDAFIKTEASN